MTKVFMAFVVTWVAVVVAACGQATSEPAVSGGQARANIAGKTFEVSNVTLSSAFGEDGYFRIEGDDAAHPNADCVPGLSGGLALYGEMPSDVTTLSALAGKELPFEFTGDGDEANLCFVGSNGLLGVEDGTVRFGAIEGTKVTFSFSGVFVLYDGKGETEIPVVEASGHGVAHAMTP
jgi:hypothetical protein